MDRLKRIQIRIIKNENNHADGKPNVSCNFQIHNA